MGDDMNKLLLLGASAALVLPLAVSAAGHRKAGLWETTMSMKYTQGGPQMPQIPPEQLAKMQQLGIKMPSMGGAPTTVQSCVTPEQAAADFKPDTGRGDCTMENQTWSGDTFSADMVCHSREGDMHGHVTGTADGDTAFTGTSTMSGSNPHMGGDFAMEQHFSSKWLGADCGTVKSYTPPQRN
jgi:hypothetical protein